MLQFQAAGAGLGKIGPITGCGAKWSKSSLTFKTTCKTDNSNPMRKGIKMTRIADRSARKMRCFVDIIFKEYAPNQSPTFILIYLNVAMVSFRFCE